MTANNKSIKDLKKRLTPEQYNICFLKGTEPPNSGKFTHHDVKGTYVCVVCEKPLFSSKTKFESSSGWPSFDDVINDGNVKLDKDESSGMIRTEVLCKNCGSHLGHVFDDGPTKTGKRYCINSLALNFTKKN